METQENLKPGKRQEIYNKGHQRLLAKLILEYDHNNTLFSSKRDAGTSEGKQRIWGLIIKDFNKLSGRETYSSRHQLVKLATKMKSEERELADNERMVKQSRESPTKALRTFQKSCAKTGGGPAPKPPESIDPDEDVSPIGNLEKKACFRNVMKNITNNRGPLITKFDDQISKKKNVYVNRPGVSKALTFDDATDQPCSEIFYQEIGNLKAPLKQTSQRPNQEAVTIFDEAGIGYEIVDQQSIVDSDTMVIVDSDPMVILESDPVIMLDSDPMEACSQFGGDVGTSSSSEISKKITKKNAAKKAGKKNKNLANKNFVQEESEASLAYIEERRKAEAEKDKLQTLQLKSAINANVLKTHWYLKKFKENGIAYPQLYEVKVSDEEES